jgi:hypothetical protein
MSFSARTSPCESSVDVGFMSQQTHPEHIEVSQADASILTQYPEDELQTIDPKVWQCAETPSQAGKASTKRRQTPGATGRSDGERPPPYLKQHRKRSAADLRNDPERPIKRRSCRVHRKIERGDFVDWRNIDLAPHADSIPSAGPSRKISPRLVRMSSSPLASCESPGMQPYPPYRSSYGSVSETQDSQAGLVSAHHAS